MSLGVLETHFIGFDWWGNPKLSHQLEPIFMKNRLIETKFWKDSYIVELSTEERLLYLYLLTNERVNIIHCYEITEREVLFDTGIDRGIYTHCKERFQKDGKFTFYKEYIYINNAGKYETYTGDLNEKAKLKLQKQMPKNVFEWYRGIYRGIDTGIYTTPIPLKIRDQRSEIKEQRSEIIKTGENLFFDEDRKVYIKT